MWDLDSLLVLAHAVRKLGENSWATVSKAVRNYMKRESEMSEKEINEKFTLKKCAAMFNKLLEKDHEFEDLSSAITRSKGFDSSTKLIADSLTFKKVQRLKLMVAEKEADIQRYIVLLKEIKEGLTKIKMQSFLSPLIIFLYSQNKEFMIWRF